jgi:hypothetical protein
MSRTYSELMPNGVVSILTFDEDEIRYSVVKDDVILYNEAIVGKYSARRAAQLAREQYEVASRASVDESTS